MNNCTNPPHFPPHCGCPAGYIPATAADYDLDALADNADTRLLAKLKAQGEALEKVAADLAGIKASLDDVELRMMLMDARMQAQSEIQPW